MSTETRDQDVTVYTGTNFIRDSLYLNIKGRGILRNWKSLLRLTDRQVIDAFRSTAQILDQDTFEQFGGGNRDYDPRTSDCYRGMVVLKRIADKRGLVLTSNKAYENMADAEQEVTAIFDPMNMWFVKELLTSESSEK